jgi:hypothetical protein
MTFAPMVAIAEAMFVNIARTNARAPHGPSCEQIDRNSESTPAICGPTTETFVRMFAIDAATLVTCGEIAGTCVRTSALTAAGSGSSPTVTEGAQRVALHKDQHDVSTLSG